VPVSKQQVATLSKNDVLYEKWQLSALPVFLVKTGVLNQVTQGTSSSVHAVVLSEFGVEVIAICEGRYESDIQHPLEPNCLQVLKRFLTASFTIHSSCYGVSPSHGVVVVTSVSTPRCLFCILVSLLPTISN
jgi:hypothetical protein